MSDEILWVEKYRPKKVSECILPNSIKSTFQEYVNKSEIPNLMLCGGAGTGKTTISKALCNEVGCDFLVINGSDENGIDVLRNKITNYATSVSLTGGRKVIIIDESDYLTPNAQAALRASMESFSKNCTFIFTCNFKNKLIEPLHSRCAVIDFRIDKTSMPKLMAQFFKRVCGILDNESITYNKEVVAQVVQKYFPDNRRILNELQRYSVSGTIDVGILSNISDVNISNLVTALKEKNFADVRKWVFENSDIDSVSFYRRMYDSCYDYLQASSIPQLVLLIGRYQYQDAFVADHELNNLAFLVECMCDLEFK